MKILACDPGETTGLAFFDTLNPGKITTRNCAPEQVVFDIHEFGKADVLVVEKFPPTCEQHLALLYEQIITYSSADYTVPIVPATWKPIAKARIKSREWDDKAPTQHEKDAIHILRFYVEIVLRKKMPKEIEICSLQSA